VERLPYIDEGTRRISTPAEQAWPGLVRTMAALSGPLPQPLIAAWGLEPDRRRGGWETTVSVGDTIPGFGVVALEPRRSLVLRGAHRFSRYELRFELTDSGPGSVLHAHTSAIFPGAAGAAYRALVIGTGGHRLAVRSLLARVAREAANLRP